MYKDPNRQKQKVHENYLKNKISINKRALERYWKSKKPCPVCGKSIGAKSTKCGPCKLLERNPCIFKKPTGKILKCFICDNEFYRQPSLISERNFCSKKCSAKGKRPKPKTGKWGMCNSCKKELWIFPRDFYRKYHFCSKDCFKNYDFGGKIELRCKLCKKNYRTYRAQIKHRGSSFCSWKCFMEYKKTKYLKHKRAKNTPSARIKKVLWGVFSRYIRQRDKGICISCGKKDDWRRMDAGHYIPKTAGLALYFDEQNVNCQCTYCNRWMHGNLSRYAIALRKEYGETILEDLDKKRNKIKKISIIEYQKMIDYYKNKLKQVGGSLY